MFWYHWMMIVSLAISMLACLAHIIKLIRLGKPIDYSQKAGDISSAIKYSFTKAMSPAKKESAYLHLPTYTAGIIYHLGTFLSIFLFFMIILDLHELLNTVLDIVIIGFLALSTISGIGILIKRLSKKTLKALSNPDDYISNILVNLYQLATAYVLFDSSAIVIYTMITSALLLYLPLGKLKHAFYFFAARYHLGYFYGWRNVWPISNHKN